MWIFEFWFLPWAGEGANSNAHAQPMTWPKETWVWGQTFRQARDCLSAYGGDVNKPAAEAFQYKSNFCYVWEYYGHSVPNDLSRHFESFCRHLKSLKVFWIYFKIWHLDSFTSALCYPHFHYSLYISLSLLYFHLTTSGSNVGIGAVTSYLHGQQRSQTVILKSITTRFSSFAVSLCHLESY